MEIKDYLPNFVTLDYGMEFDATTIKELKEIAKQIV